MLFPRAGCGHASTAASAFLDYFRCPSDAIVLETAGALSRDEEYFTFFESTCFGRRCQGTGLEAQAAGLPNVTADAVYTAGHVRLPFDLSEVATNLRQERYRQPRPRLLERIASATAVRRLYYFLRPLLNVAVRKHLQRLRLHGWSDIAFPRWPVDATVDTLMRRTMTLALQSRPGHRIPFIWFWPGAAAGCVMVTHDVEGRSGIDFCERLMDVDDSFGVKSAFEIVPEGPGIRVETLAARLRARGFEVNLHDLNHDGNLFTSRPTFQHRATLINRYARDLGCRGFRSGAMYREQEWYDALQFSYDMSVPTVAHLEPQRGGCCTVTPYFVGDILELPLTTTQDYSLFHIIGQYSTVLWQQQIDEILEYNGLISFLAHPDYLREARALDVYRELMARLVELRAAGKVWIALPSEIDEWWRNRAAMTLVSQGSSWRISGNDSERARVAYATLVDGRLTFEHDDGSGGEATERRLP